MSSGIEVAEECKAVYQEINRREKSAIILRIKEDLSNIVIDRVFDTPKGDVEAAWKEIIAELPENACRFILCDFLMQETPTVTKSKIVCVAWNPDYSPVKMKMVFASSQEAVTTAMPVQKTIQGTELSEVSYATLKDAVFGK